MRYLLVVDKTKPCWWWSFHFFGIIQKFSIPTRTAPPCSFRTLRRATSWVPSGNLSLASKLLCRTLCIKISTTRQPRPHRMCQVGLPEWSLLNNSNLSCSQERRQFVICVAKSWWKLPLPVTGGFTTQRNSPATFATNSSSERVNSRHTVGSTQEIYHLAVRLVDAIRSFSQNRAVTLIGKFVARKSPSLHVLNATGVFIQIINSSSTH